MMSIPKRQAEIDLCPSRHSKHLRLSPMEYSEDRTSISEDGLPDRYYRLFADGGTLLWDTVRYPFSSQPRRNVEHTLPNSHIQDEATSTSSTPSTPAVSTPAQTPKPDVSIATVSQQDISVDQVDIMLISPQRKAIASPDHLNLSSIQPTSRTPSSSNSEVDSFTHAFDVSSNLIHVDGAHFQSTPKRRTSSTTPMCSPARNLSNLSREPTEIILNGGMDGLNLQSSYSSSSSSQIHFKSSTRSRASTLRSTHGSDASQRRSSRRRKREHILKNAHRAAVLKAKKEALKKQLYQINKAIGYQSPYPVFKEHLEYRRKLEKLTLEVAPLPPHPSSQFTTGELPPIRPSDDESDFLERYLNNAKATLASAKPLKPFHPTYDRLKGFHRAQDKAIEQFLHPTPPAKLPSEVDETVDKILRKQGVVAKVAREQVSDVDISRLRPGIWLNDEIINFYGALILARSEASKENLSQGQGAVTGLLNVHYFSSFFWSKLTKEGYQQGRLAKWTKKIDIFSKDIVLIPVNYSNQHWTAAAINFRRKRLESYDSMDMAKDIVFRQLRLYLDAEHKDKKKKPFDFTDWTVLAPDHTPQQENGYDCGVFTCHFLEALSRGEEVFTFSQRDMPYLRRRMIWEIGNAQLRPPYE